MLVVLMAVLMFLSIGSCITQKFKIKQESSVSIAFLSILLFLYISGLFNLMKLAVYIIYFITLCSIIYIIYCFIKKKIKIKEIMTPGIILYIFVVLGMALIVKNTYYCEWDEFSHWGANLKAMVQHNLFWSNKIYDGVHVVYTPMAGIAEYLLCKINGGFAEDISYIGINIFIITLLLPIFKNEQYKIKEFFKLILFWGIVYCSIILCNFKLSSIYIDLLLGILFAVGMFLAFRLKGKEDKINLLLILIIMPLVKDSGLLLLGIILMQLFFNKIFIEVIKNKKVTKQELKKFGIIVAILIISLIFYGTWKIYCSANNRYLDDRHDKNAISQINVKEFIKAILMLKTENSKYSDIATSFYKALNNLAVIGNENSIISAIKLVVILDIIGLIIYVINKDKNEKRKIVALLASFNIGFILYCLLLLATFMFAFTEAEGRNLASYTRYMATYFIAWILVMAVIAINNNSNNQIIIAIMAILLCIYPINTTNLLNIFGRKGVTGVSEQLKEKSNIIMNKVKLNEKVYLIYQNIGGGGEYHILRYLISPIVTNLMYEWSLGPKYEENDIWSYDITKEQFEKKLIDEEFDYIFIAKIDKQFIDIYGDLIDNSIYDNYEELNNKLLKVNKIDENSVKLTIIDD